MIVAQSSSAHAVVAYGAAGAGVVVCAVLAAPAVALAARRKVRAFRCWRKAAAAYWRHWRHPHPVASAEAPTVHDYRAWAHGLPESVLRRLDNRNRKLKERGRLRGGRIVEARAIRLELEADALAGDTTIANVLSDADRNFISRTTRGRKAS